MYKIPLGELKEKLLASGKISSEKLEQYIKEKINDLSGLISEEGAAHIIANELGVEIVPEAKDKLKIKEVYVGMRNISTVGKVVKKFEVREFAKGEKTGKVCSLIFGDETGTIRVVFWNEQVDLLNEIKEDDILLVKNAYVRENRDAKEIHLGNAGEIEVNPEGETISSVRQSAEFTRKEIGALQGGEERVEIMGTIVQVFDPRFFYTCPECRKRVLEVETGHECSEHGIIKPNMGYVMNAILDDGTGNIRGVFWRDQTNHLLDKAEEEVVTFKENLALFEDVKTDLLGEQYKLMGRVQKNEMFDRLEFNVQLVEKANPKEELEKK